MDVTNLTDEELDQILTEVYAEQARRSSLTTIPDRINELNIGYLAAQGTVPGQDWRQPTGPFDAYPVDWEVLHNGKTWVSTIPFNVWEPGISSWREVVPEGAPPPDWVQPDSTNPYMIGDKVTFEGQIWESLIDNNVWSPTGYPQGWAVVPA
jgi:hypothetical protein